MSEIFSALVYLDDDMPEYMEGVIRVGSVRFFDESGEEIENVDLNNRLVDNREFHDVTDLLNSVAKRLGIEPSNVELGE